jgi:hypothetical protein
MGVVGGDGVVEAAQAVALAGRLRPADPVPGEGQALTLTFGRIARRVSAQSRGAAATRSLDKGHPLEAGTIAQEARS